MNAIKEFLKPNLLKIILFVVIMVLFFSSVEGYISDNTMFCGIPEGCEPSPADGKVAILGTYVDPIALRIIFYLSAYLLSSFTYLIFNKIKK